MTSNTLQLYRTTQSLFRAFHYLQPRMKGGALAPPQPMNGEALAGCILHSCMAQLVRELQQRREQRATETKRALWLVQPQPAVGTSGDRTTHDHKEVAMKTQISKQQTDVVAVQPLTTFHKEDRMKKHSSTALKLAAICAMAVTSTLTAFASNGHCDPAPTTTMVAWYPFDEISGLTSANLATQNTGNWAPDGVLVPADGMVGGSLYFDGNTAYIDSPSSIVTNIGPATDYNSPSSCGGAYSTCQGNFSFAVWIRVSNLIAGSTYTILDKRSFNPNPYGYSFGLYKDGLGNDKIFLQLADGQGSLGYTNYISDSLPSLNGTGWHHVALTVNRSSTPGPYGITFYLDRQVKGIGFRRTGRALCGITVPFGSGPPPRQPRTRTGFPVTWMNFRCGIARWRLAKYRTSSMPGRTVFAEHPDRPDLGKVTCSQMGNASRRRANHPASRF